LAKGPKYVVPYRRRKEAKTDYRVRRVLATSSTPRLVVRPSSRNVTIQLVESKVDGDRVLAQARSKELSKYGWLGGTKNTPSVYLIGLLAGRRAVKNGIKEANLDIGLARPTKGSRLFAAVKGAQDAGLSVPCDNDVFPGPSRIEGATISEYAGSAIEETRNEGMFSEYLKRGMTLQDLPEHFRAVKAKIEGDETV